MKTKSEPVSFLTISHISLSSCGLKSFSSLTSRPKFSNIFCCASRREKVGVFFIIVGNSAFRSFKCSVFSFLTCSKINLTVISAISFTSSQPSIKAISASSETISVRCLVVALGSARKILLTEKTRSKADITICL